MEDYCISSPIKCLAKRVASKIRISVDAVLGRQEAEFSCDPFNCKFGSGDILSATTTVDKDDNGSSGGFSQSRVVEFKVPDVAELLSGVVEFDSDSGFPVVPMGSPRLSVDQSLGASSLRTLSSSVVGL